MATITCRLYENAQVYATPNYATTHYGQDLVHVGGGNKIVLNLLRGVVTGVFMNTGSAGYGLEIGCPANEFYNDYSFVRYYHFSRAPFVGMNQLVEIGQAIGHEGSTGNSTGSHCHVEWMDKNRNRVLNESDITGVPQPGIGQPGVTYDNDYYPGYVPPIITQRKIFKGFLYFKRRF